MNGNYVTKKVGMDDVLNSKKNKMEIELKGDGRKTKARKFDFFPSLEGNDLQDNVLVISFEILLLFLLSRNSTPSRRWKEGTCGQVVSCSLTLRHTLERLAATFSRHEHETLSFFIHFLLLINTAQVFNLLFLVFLNPSFLSPLSARNWKASFSSFEGGTGNRGRESPSRVDTKIVTWWRSINLLTSGLSDWFTHSLTSPVL